MGKLGKILAVLIIGCLLFLGVTYWAAHRYLTPERVKSLVIPPLEEATGLKVELKEIRRKGFAGVGITGLRFREPQSGQEVLAVEEMRLGLKLTPLLKGELVVTEATFIKPKLAIIREKDGRLNIEDLIGTKETPSSKEPSRLALIFQSLRVKDAEITFKDLRGEYPPAAARFSLAASLKLSGTQIMASGQGALGLEVAGYPLGKGLAFKLETQGTQTRLLLTKGEILAGSPQGECLIAGESLTGDFSLKKASFNEVALFAHKLKPYLFPEAELPPLAGQFDLAARFQKKKEAYSYRFSFLPSPLETQVENLALKVSGEITADQNEITPELDVRVNEQALNLKGKVLLGAAVPHLDLEILTDHLDLRALAAKGEKEEGEEKEAPATQKPSLVVPAEGQIRFLGKEVCYRICAQDVKTVLKISPQKIALKDLSLLLAGAIVQASGQVADLAGTPKLRLAYSLAGADFPLLVKAFVPEGNYFTSGRLWSEGTFWGRGLTAEELKKTLSGQGQAKFLNLGLKETTISSMVAQLLDMPALKKLVFEKGALAFTIKDGLADVKGKFSRQGLEVLILGKVGLDGRLNLKPKLFLTGEMARIFAQRFPGASLFKTEKGYEVSLAVTGTFEEPKVSLIEGVKEKVKEKAVKELFKFLGQ